MRFYYASCALFSYLESFLLDLNSSCYYSLAHLLVFLDSGISRDCVDVTWQGHFSLILIDGQLLSFLLDMNSSDSYICCFFLVLFLAHFQVQALEDFDWSVKNYLSSYCL